MWNRQLWKVICENDFHLTNRKMNPSGKLEDSTYNYHCVATSQNHFLAFCQIFFTKSHRQSVVVMFYHLWFQSKLCYLGPFWAGTSSAKISHLFLFFQTLKTEFYFWHSNRITCIEHWYSCLAQSWTLITLSNLSTKEGRFFSNAPDSNYY